MNTAARKPTAWELEYALLEAIAELEATPEDQDVPEDVQQLVFDCLDAAADKRDALAGAMKRKEAEIAALERRAKDAREKAYIAERGLARLESYILTVLDIHGVKQLRGEQYRIGWQQNPPHVELVPEFVRIHDGAPSPFVRDIPACQEPNKQAVLEALKRGDNVAGARLVEGARRVVVR